MEKSDKQLMQGVREGDEESFAILMGRYKHRLTNYFYTLLNNYDRAAEATQEAFVKVFLKADTFDMDKSFSSWIYRIGMNYIIDEYRKKQRWTSFLGRHFKNNNGSFPTSYQPPAPDEELIRDEKVGKVRKAINSLPLKYRVPLAMKDLQELPYNEIADIMDMSTGTVKSRINRARLLLKEKLARQM